MTVYLPKPPQKRPIGWLNYVFSGLAPATAAIFTNPLDVARVRMQLNGEGAAEVSAQNESSRYWK